MKKLVLFVSAFLLFAFILSGCKSTTGSNDESEQQDFEKAISSDVPLSSQPVSSIQQESSSAPVSSEITVSSEVVPPSSDTPVVYSSSNSISDEEVDNLIKQREQKQREIEKLSKLSTEYETVLDKEIYPIGTEKINLKITNKGPGCLWYMHYYYIYRFEENDWVCLNPKFVPNTMGYDPLMPNENLDENFSTVDMLTQAGKYKIRVGFQYGDVDEDRIIEFSVE